LSLHIVLPSSSASSAEIDIIELCGNGVVDGDETCDDGNVVAEDGCSPTCRRETVIASEPVCGNGILEEDERCDDGNRVDLDDCSNRCLLGQTLRCEDDEDCASGRCIDGRCTTRSNDQPCTEDVECLSGHCSEGLCRPCRFSRDCPAGTLCLSERCTAPGSRIAPVRRAPTEVQGAQAILFPPQPSPSQLAADLEALRRQIAFQAYVPGPSRGDLAGQSTPDTGPAAVALMAAGAAAGVGWIRRRRGRG
jgi:cysteine-rich repeat protein